jgi:hypothetical protein
MKFNKKSWSEIGGLLLFFAIGLMIGYVSKSMPKNNVQKMEQVPLTRLNTAKTMPPPKQVMERDCGLLEKELAELRETNKRLDAEVQALKKASADKDKTLASVQLELERFNKVKKKTDNLYLRAEGLSSTQALELIVKFCNKYKNIFEKHGIETVELDDIIEEAGRLHSESCNNKGQLFDLTKIDENCLQEIPKDLFNRTLNIIREIVKGNTKPPEHGEDINFELDLFSYRFKFQQLEIAFEIANEREIDPSAIAKAYFFISSARQ